MNVLVCLTGVLAAILAIGVVLFFAWWGDQLADQLWEDYHIDEAIDKYVSDNRVYQKHKN